MNRNYAKLEEGALVYAPSTVRLDAQIWLHPTAEQYAMLGWLPVVEEPPAEDPPEGSRWVPAGWEEADGAIRRTWEAEEIPPPPAPPPRRWSRLSIKTALAQSGMLAAAKEFFGATEIAPGYPAWEALSDCDYIEEGYPTDEAWNALLDGAASALGKTREEIDAFLALIPTE